ncbi:MAG: aldose epimerase family protein [Planctomycetota bacterium]|jgi:aldose 1-epimerase
MLRKKNFVCLAAVLLIMAMMCCSCTKRDGDEKPSPKPQRAELSVEKQNFGKTADGEAVELYTLTNSNGLKAKIMTYGGILVSLEVPDRNGKLTDVVLGYETLSGYVSNNPYFGATVGRYANRIANGEFTLDGTRYELAKNNGENHLHGGIKGFDKVVWAAESFKEEGAAGLKLTYLSKDGEEGYPGNLTCTVTYTLTNDNGLKISFDALTDKATVVNLSHHSYFNLAGQGVGDILGHRLMINADRFTPVDAGLIPTGELRSVKGTPMDFTKPFAIGARINEDDQQLKYGGGYDHNWVLNKTGDELALAVRVYEPSSGRVMEVYTTEPGVQFYAGNFLDGSITGKGNKVYKHRYGFCLEPQHFPDSPNKPDFPSVVLRPGQRYAHITIYKFSVR